MKLDDAARAKLQGVLDDPNESPRAKKAIRLALQAIDREIPTGRPGLASKKRAAIIVALKNGDTQKVVAKAHEVSVRTIANIAREEKITRYKPRVAAQQKHESEKTQK